MGREVKKVHLDFDWRDKTMNKKEFENSEKPLTFICSIDPKTGKVLFDFYDGWDNDLCVKDFRKDFPKMITFMKLNKSACKLRAKELFNIVEEDFVKNKNIESNNSQQPKDTLVKQGGVAKADELQVDSDNGSPADTFSKVQESNHNPQTPVLHSHTEKEKGRRVSEKVVASRIGESRLPDGDNSFGGRKKNWKW